MYLAVFRELDTQGALSTRIISCHNFGPCQELFRDDSAAKSASGYIVSVDNGLNVLPGTISNGFVECNYFSNAYGSRILQLIKRLNTPHLRKTLGVFESLSRSSRVATPPFGSDYRSLFCPDKTCSLIPVLPGGKTQFPRKVFHFLILSIFKHLVNCHNMEFYSRTPWPQCLCELLRFILWRLGVDYTVVAMAS